MTPTDRDHLADNIAWHLSQGVERSIQERAVRDYWTKVDADLGARIARDVGLSVPPIIAQGKGAEHDAPHRARLRRPDTTWYWTFT